MNMNQDLKELVIKAKENDEQAITHLYNMTIQRVTFVARKYIKDEDVVNDVLQDSYIKAFQNLDQLEDESKFDKWLNTIVARKCKDVLKKRHDATFTDVFDDEYPPEDFIEDSHMEFSPKEASDYTELKMAMSHIIDELNTEQKMCILMFYYQQYTIKEIAKTLEVSENTIKSRLNYGKKKIEEKVLDLERKGFKIRGIAPIPFLVWMFTQEEMGTTLPAISTPIFHLVQDGTYQGLKASHKIINETIKHGIKTKVIIGTSVAITGAVGGYYLYNKAHTVNLTENIEYVELGTNGSGYIKIVDNDVDSQLIQDYQLSENKQLSNGDTVTITVKYDKNYAKDKGLKVENPQRTIKINNLTDKYQNLNYDTILEQIIYGNKTNTGAYNALVRYFNNNVHYFAYKSHDSWTRKAESSVEYEADGGIIRSSIPKTKHEHFDFVEKWKEDGKYYSFQRGLYVNTTDEVSRSYYLFYESSDKAISSSVNSDNEKEYEERDWFELNGYFSENDEKWDCQFDKKNLIATFSIKDYMLKANKDGHIFYIEKSDDIAVEYYDVFDFNKKALKHDDVVQRVKATKNISYNKMKKIFDEGWKSHQDK